MEATTTPTRSFTCHDNLTRFFARIKSLFTKVIPTYLLQHITGVLHFVEILKSVIENPTVEGFLKPLADKLSPELYAAIESNLDKAVAFLELEATCNTAATFEDKVKCVADHLALVNPVLQKYLIHALAVELTRLTSQDEQTTEKELSALVAFAENEIAHEANTPTA